jgi:anti-anti-sigma factor
MEIKVTTQNARVPVTVIHVEGNLDSASYQDFQTKAEELISGGAHHVLVDFTKAPYISSAGLRALHQIFNKLRKADPAETMTEEEVRQGINAGSYKSPHLKLLNLSHEARTAFDMGGFDLYLETFTDLQKALAAF